MIFKPRAVLAGVPVAVLLCYGYLRMARTQPINADGASNAIQAWDMLHGNPLLRGWTVTDVSFYTTELIQYAIVELVHGYRADVIPVAAAITYTLLVLLVAVVAKGTATGWVGLARVAIAVAVVLVPAPETGYVILLGSPDHTGTAVPLLLTWLVLDRWGSRRWAPYAVALMLAWGLIGDPLVLFVGVAPLVAVSLLRLLRGRFLWRGLDGRLAAAGLSSVVLAQLFLLGVRRAGGFRTHPPILERSPLHAYGERAWIAVKGLAANFGGYLPDQHGPAGVAIGVLHLACAALALYAFAVTLRRIGSADRLHAVWAIGIVVNLAAFVVSALPADLMAARQLAVVLPYGAVLAARVCADRLVSWRLVPALAGVLLVFAGTFVVQAGARPVPLANEPLVAWLTANDLRHGIGNYWTANNITLASGGRVTVAPVTGGDHIRGYRWESTVDWYDPARDARFLLVDLEESSPEVTLAAAAAQFGPPVERRDFGRVAVLRYDHNLLVGLTAYCVPGVAPSMADC
ncbi:MAG TPA: hypothetical protein VFE14_16415 [Micromonosporaceae bacterium]|nr:hypothetical protein [Micromonosporaceae bacterium]